MLLVRTTPKLSNILVISWAVLLTCLWKRWNNVVFSCLLWVTLHSCSLCELFSLKRSRVLQVFPYEDLGLMKCHTYRKSRVPHSANQSNWAPALPAWKKYMFSLRLYPTTKYGQDSIFVLISIVSIHYVGGGLAVHPPTVRCWFSVALDNSMSSYLPVLSLDTLSDGLETRPLLSSLIFFSLKLISEHTYFVEVCRTLWCIIRERPLSCCVSIYR
jgi:hypothetical protein